MDQTSSTGAESADRIPIVCEKCGRDKGVVIVKEGKKNQLLMPSGDSIRFPYTIRCICGKNIKWNEGKKRRRSRRLRSSGLTVEQAKDQNPTDNQIQPSAGP